jgi:MFS transporter, FHS family, glucose/mannose:H+ symporter
MQHFNKKLVFISACFGMLIFGVVMAVLGSVLPSVIHKFGIGTADAGSLFILLSLGMLGGSLLFGPVVDRFGYKALLVISAGAIVAGLQGIAFAPDMYLLRLALFLTGFFGGAINGGTNALVSDISEGKRSSRLTYLGVFFGVGAFGVPLLLGSMLEHFTYETLISAVGVMIILPFFLFLFLQFPSPKHARGFPLLDGLGLLKDRMLLLFGLVLVLQSGLEMSMGGWSAAFFVEELAVDAGRAVLYLSLFWFGMMMARAVLGYLLQKLSAAAILRTSFLVSFSGSTIMLASGSITAGVIGLMLAGFGFAAVFPVILAYVGDLYSRLSGTAFSVVLAMALIGGISVPWIIGVIAEDYGLRNGLLLIPASIAIAFLLFQRIMAEVSMSGKPGPSSSPADLSD